MMSSPSYLAPDTPLPAEPAKLDSTVIDQLFLSHCVAGYMHLYCDVSVKPRTISEKLKKKINQTAPSKIK